MVIDNGWNVINSTTSFSASVRRDVLLSRLTQNNNWSKDRRHSSMVLFLLDFMFYNIEGPTIQSHIDAP